ncbi:mycofactocin biosynthesis peptidyl-dipeptidase MftE [Streptomyces sp. NPDC005799]|uniref:mycofactocin biosynthesis peptidyl-dipeptidase MftE n=1 Tax=Streptomyces sp. NPDC005799 TaxID=3154678 RepID=UPI0033C542AC
MPTDRHQAARPAPLAHLTWPKVPANPLVLVPVGATEQHGPHLPLHTDSVIATAVARSVAAELSAVLAPTIAYGASGEHAGFPGTVSIGRDALRVVLVETVRSLSTWAGRTVFVNGHGGNVSTLDAAVGSLRHEGHDVAWLGCEVPGGDAHAGRTETSLMLHLAPADVRLAEAVPGDTRPLADLLPELMAQGVRHVSPTGVLGDPAGATASEGRALLASMVSAALSRVSAGCTGRHGRLVATSEECVCVPPCRGGSLTSAPPATLPKEGHS